MMNLFRNFNELFENRTTYKVGVLQDKAYRVLKSHTREALKGKKISTIEWATLGIAHEGKDVTSKELSELLGVTQAFVSKMLKDLMKKDLICIEKCTDDSRIKYISLTSHGRDFVRETEPYLRSQIKPLLSGVSLSDLAGYIRVLTALSNQNKSK